MSNSICFTGKLENFTRKTAQEAAKEHGFDVRPGVNAGLTYLVSAKPNSTSSKFRKASELGVKIISEADFMQLIGMSASAKRTIWDVLADDCNDLNNDRDALKKEVKSILSDCMLSDCKDRIAKLGLSEDEFVDKVVDKLLDGSLDFDESWDDGEYPMQIEELGYDLANGDPVGTHANGLAEILGTNANGQLNRVFGTI